MGYERNSLKTNIKIRCLLENATSSVASGAHDIIPCFGDSETFRGHTNEAYVLLSLQAYTSIR